VFELFEQWQAAAPDERPARLARLCEQRPELAAKLQALVQADAVAIGDGAALSLALPEPSHNRVGAVVGAWRLERLLGSGGMGEVWLASRNDTLHQGQAAIKLLQAHQRSPAAQARFAAEARLLARLAHPHIARLLDVGIDAAGQRHLVLEYIAGEAIDRWCAAHNSPVAERLRLFLQVCDAVAHAHAQLVVHRDLKPSNILVDADGQAKLLDFGVAKLLDDDAEGLTRTGLAALTPEYAAPEQWVGEPASVAADVYALGVVLFELLSGQRPHAGGATAAAWRQRLETEPQRLRKLVAALHGDLDAIAAKALQPVPADRYPSVLALADDLRRHLAHEPVLAAAQTLSYRLRKLVRRHRGTVATGSLAAAGLLAVGGVAVWQAVQAREASAVARTEADKAEAARDFLLGLFGEYGAGDEKARRYREMSVGQALEVAGRRLLDGRELPPAVRLDLLSHLGRLHVLLGMDEAGARMEQEAWALARVVHGSRSPAYVLATLAYGANLAAAGHIADALARLGETITITARPGWERSDLRALAYKQFGLVCVVADDPRAPAHLAQAIKLYTQWDHHDERVSTHAALLRWHLQGEDFEAFEREASRTAAVVAKSERRFVFDRYAFEVELAARWLLTGDEALARAALVRALPAVESGFGSEHPRAVRVRRQIALLEQRLGDRASAHRSLVALAAAPLHRVIDEPTWREMAEAHWIEGDLTAARRQIQLALQAPALRPGERAERQRVAAEIELLAGLPQAALESVQPVISRFAHRPGAGSIALQQARLLRAEAWAALGQRDEAQRELNDIVGWSESRGSLPRVGRVRSRALVTLSALRRPQDPVAALRLARQALAGRSAQDAVLDDRLLWAGARVAQARALKAMGRNAEAAAAAASAAAQLARDQVPDSPRLAAARRP
jgi:serine/threonine-protein kinase